MGCLCSKPENEDGLVGEKESAWQAGKVAAAQTVQVVENGFNAEEEAAVNARAEGEQNGADEGAKAVADAQPEKKNTPETRQISAKEASKKELSKKEKSVRGPSPDGEDIPEGAATEENEEAEKKTSEENQEEAESTRKVVEPSEDAEGKKTDGTKKKKKKKKDKEKEKDKSRGDLVPAYADKKDGFDLSKSTMGKMVRSESKQDQALRDALRAQSSGIPKSAMLALLEVSEEDKAAYNADADQDLKKKQIGLKETGIIPPPPPPPPSLMTRNVSTREPPPPPPPPMTHSVSQKMTQEGSFKVPPPPPAAENEPQAQDKAEDEAQDEAQDE